MNARLVALVLAIAVPGAPAAARQQPPVPPAPPQAQAAPSAIPVQAQIVISRYQGEKKISSLPYLLSMKTGPGRSASLRVGSRVPVRGGTPFPQPPDKPPFAPVTYEQVGTNIDCYLTALQDGRFQLEVSIEETSVATDVPEATTLAPGYPVFRSYQSTNTMFLRDGETAQYTAGTDRVSGEVVRVDVTLRVVK